MFLIVCIFLSKDPRSIQIFTSVWPINTNIYIGMADQYRYLYRYGRSIQIFTSVWPINTYIYIGMADQYRYLHRYGRSIQIFTSVWPFNTDIYIGMVYIDLICDQSPMHGCESLSVTCRRSVVSSGYSGTPVKVKFHHHHHHHRLDMTLAVTEVLSPNKLN